MQDYDQLPTMNAAGKTGAYGLYDPQRDQDSCGVGFISKLDAIPEHSIIQKAIQILINLEHRGAVGGDKSTGDGAGLLIQLPDKFFRNHSSELGIKLPEQGNYAVAMTFLPTDSKLADECKKVVEKHAEAEGGEILGWREVPISDSHLGHLAKSTEPQIAQFILGRGKIAPKDFERKLYVIRRLIEKEVASWTAVDVSQFYISSFSGQTIVYKGLLTGSQITQFYPDLNDASFQSALALVHQRYSTNTLPTWNLAQPFRFMAHNGEINTLRGNINRMKSREYIFKSDLFGDDLEKIIPIIDESASDSAIFDMAFELLVMAGRSLPHVMMMMIPEAYGVKIRMSEDKRSFYDYHSSFMEPWDGPAAIGFTDGKTIGATLDRNGLRPARYTVTREGLIVMASETGVLDIPAEKIRRLGRLQPGKMFLANLEQHRIVPDNEIKAKISRQQPYRRWVKEHRIELRGLFAPSEHPGLRPERLLELQHVFGYTDEELRMLINPMASRGQEAIGSMGNDAALPVLSDRPQLVFSYFKQLFAQVTNPPIDPLREELVMSLASFVGNETNILDETPEHCRGLKLHHPILTPDDLFKLRKSNHPDLITKDIDILFPANGTGEDLKQALNTVFIKAEQAFLDGATILILTDQNANKDFAPISSLLVTAGLHHYLKNHGLRTAGGIIVESGEPREVMHFALLVGYGADAICPYLAFSTARTLAEQNLLEMERTPEEALDNYITAIKKGLLKTLSRMGISTLRSFFGAQIFEALGLGKELIDTYFCNTVSRIGGIGLEEIAKETLERHQKAFPQNGATPPPLLDVGGVYHIREKGEKHFWSPEAIHLLQLSTRVNDYKIFKQFSQIIDDSARNRGTIRSLLRFKKTESIPLEEVESASEIVKRFVTAAMSFGSISKDAHEAIAIAMNRLGGRSNSGEGGEDPVRFKIMPNGDSKRSAIKQVASGRFGVTTEYLVNANELQIKMAQGAKPGEGGQLPGHKVSTEIARVRHTTPGVTLISPPPHHDIYSIEDIAQLIYDLKAVNPEANVSVKLVSEVGVGTVASGISKAKSDLVLISGHDGGTGASPLTAIKHAGLAWELGLAETQQALIQNHLRDKIKVQTDGQLKTGRDLAIATLLGAEEFGFGTSILITLGCIMMRKCHLNTCPVGVATQDPELRSRFKGKPEYVERFLLFIAEELREYMAMLGFRKLDDMVGRVDLLDVQEAIDHWKGRKLDLSPILSNLHVRKDAVLRCIRRQEDSHSESLNFKIVELAKPAIENAQPVKINLAIRNIDRTLGATLSGKISKKYGSKGLPEDTIHLNFFGSAGQSLGAFLAPGIRITVEGDTNDYMGKGMSGGKIILRPPKEAVFKPHENVIVGNVVLYGATGGEVYINGLAGERFAVRNSGATAVVEGTGDHGCEYMTGGTVVILGSTGNNFAAGMSGGIAYVYDEAEMFDTRCNLDMVDLETVWDEADKAQLRQLIENHLKYTGSARAAYLLQDWEAHCPFFVKVMPIDYRKVLERMRLEEDTDKATLSATEEVYEA